MNAAMATRVRAHAPGASGLLPPRLPRHHTRAALVHHPRCASAPPAPPSPSPTTAPPWPTCRARHRRGGPHSSPPCTPTPQPSASTRPRAAHKPDPGHYRLLPRRIEPPPPRPRAPPPPPVHRRRPTSPLHPPRRGLREMEARGLEHVPGPARLQDRPHRRRRSGADPSPTLGRKRRRVEDGIFAKIPLRYWVIISLLTVSCKNYEQPLKSLRSTHLDPRPTFCVSNPMFFSFQCAC